MIISFLEKTNKMLEKATEDLLIALNLSLELWENSIVGQMEKGYDQQIAMAQASITQKLMFYKSF